MDTTLVLIPFPEQPGSESTSWSIARVVVPTGDVSPLLTALSGRGVGYYPEAPDGDQARALLLLNLYDEAWLGVVRTFTDKPSASIEVVAHDTYDFSWRLPPGPVHVGTKLQLVSTAAAARGSHGDIVLDPGLAFGDFRHPTTCLSTGAILGLVDSGAVSSLLDVGCGSGILFLLAARLGVKSLAATDISPYARYVARRNASLNSVSISVTTDIPGGARFDVVVANVWARAFPDLAEALCASMAEEGSLILSGFSASEAESVMASFPTLRFERREQDGWCALLGARI